MSEPPGGTGPPGGGSREPERGDEFVTAPVPAPAGRAPSRARLGTAAATAGIVLVAVLVGGWLAMRGGGAAPGATDRPPGGPAAARAVPAPAPARAWHGVLALPGRSPQAAVLLLRPLEGGDPGPGAGWSYALYATTWLARGRADLDRGSGALRLDGRVRLVRQRDVRGVPVFRAVAPWGGELREVPR